MNIVKGLQEVKVQVSTDSCLKVVQNNLKDIKYAELIRMFWNKYKLQNNINEDWFIETNQGQLSWMTSDGHGQYERDVFLRVLTEDESALYHLILDLITLSEMSALK